MVRLTVIPPNFGPGSFSTMKHVMPSGARAAKVTRLARSPLVTHILVPSITYSSPSGVALHRSACVSLPASGSDKDRQPPLPLVLGAVAGDQPRGHHVGVEDPAERHPARRDLLDDARVGRRVEA